MTPTEGVAVVEAVAVMGKPEVKGKLNTDGDFVYETGEIEEINLSNGNKLGLGKDSQLNFLYQGLKNKDPKLLEKDNWYTLENLYFESGKETLKPTSVEQLSKLEALLKEFPEMTIKLGGYTDNTGTEEGNKLLSNQRAETAKNKLVELGISKDRIQTEGYGSQFPVCTANDTPECKAKNRRIDVRVLSL
jgi:K(+)-stimulated pyrophosphate-energized sodium pump